MVLSSKINFEGTECIYMDWTSIVIRLLAATLCGGLLGMERERKKRPAGLRTYILVCMGAALVIMTNIYITDLYGTGDPTRLAAQVVSGIGFLGAGTIIVTTRNRVRGLTTAAGLWASACMGIAIGAGFYIGACAGCIIVFLVMTVLHGLDERFLAKAKRISLYVEFSDNAVLSAFMQYIKERGIRIADLEFARNEMVSGGVVSVLITLRLPKRTSHEVLLTELGTFPGITLMEEV